MHLNPRGDVSIAEIVVYAPCLVASAVLLARHRFRKSSTWIYTLAISLLRIIGSIMQLVSIDHPSEAVIRGYVIIDSIGIAPLLFATLGLLSRLAYWKNGGSRVSTSIIVFHLIHLGIVGAVVLCIVGATTGNNSSNGTIQPTAVGKAGILVYFGGWAACSLMTLLAIRGRSLIPRDEQKSEVVVVVALPFILVRLIYSACATFLHNSTFNLFGGSVGAFAGMAVAEEMIVVLLYIVLGFMLSRIEWSKEGPGSGSQGAEYGAQQKLDSYPVGPASSQV